LHGSQIRLLDSSTSGTSFRFALPAVVAHSGDEAPRLQR
jgi:hypothetical protein